MRLLFYIHAIAGGGAERVLITLVNEFLERGYEIAISCDTTRPMAYKLDDRVKLFNVRDKCRPNNILSKFRTYRILRNLYNIRKAAKEYKPDIAISFMTGTNAIVIPMLFGLKIPVIVSEHTTLYRNLGGFFQFARKYLYRFADAVTVLTRDDYSQFKRSNFVYMPNPISDMHIDKNISKQRNVLAVGRVTHWKIKGFDTLIKAWSLIYNDFPEWNLIIAGTTDDESLYYLQSLAEDSNCKNYKFVGFQSNISDWMKSSEIYVLSSRVEGMPMGLLEALACGCTCVAFDIKTGPKEILGDNYKLLARNYNPSELAEKLKLSMASLKVREESTANRNIILKRYSTNRIVNRWEILFNKIIKG